MRKRTFVKWLPLFVIGCLISIYGMACSSQPQATSESTQAKPPLVVAVQPWIGFRGHYIAMAENLFAPEGLTVKEEFFQVATDTNTALASGKADMAWIGGADLLTLVAQAPSLKIIMASDYSNGSDGIVGRNVVKPEDVKGKKVAREDAPYSIVFLATYLAQGGLTEKDLDVVPLSAADAMTAFIAGRVDVATTYEPWLSKAKSNIIFTSKGTNAIPLVLATREEVIQNRRDEVLSYLKVIDKAIAFAESNPEKAAEIVAKQLGVTPEEIPAQLAGIRPFNIKSNREEVFNSNHPLSLVKSLDAASKTLYQLGKIPHPIDANTLVDDSFVKAL